MGAPHHTPERRQAAINARPAPTPEQYADARRCCLRLAPDLYGAIFGEEGA